MTNEPAYHRIKCVGVCKCARVHVCQFCRHIADDPHRSPASPILYVYDTFGMQPCSGGVLVVVEHLQTEALWEERIKGIV